jgi:hypothetical protein
MLIHVWELSVVVVGSKATALFNMLLLQGNFMGQVIEVRWSYPQFGRATLHGLECIFVEDFFPHVEDLQHELGELDVVVYHHFAERVVALVDTINDLDESEEDER